MKMKSVGTLVKHPIAFVLIVLILIFALLLSSKAANAANMPTIKQILEVVDGNTLKVSTIEDDTFIVRLKGVDAPELGQEFGQESLNYLKKLVADKNILVEYSGKDRWGNRLVYVTTKNGKSINEMMIKEGFGWVDRFFVSQENLMELQKVAQTKNSGLWVKDEPMAPWVYDRIQIRENSEGR
ncbi:MAG: thermonuclease family protein [Cyclobacteriaceae bacterium]|nr:thermonuclease family protein [Cyclobacteriaceae bacterium]